MGKELDKLFFCNNDKQNESGWQGSKNHKYKEWLSPDGKRKITVIVFGGPDYGDNYMKEIHLSAIGQMAKGEMMRVQVITEPNTKEIKYNIYLEAITEVNNESWTLAEVCYFSHNDGKASAPSSWSPLIREGKYKNISHKEFCNLCVSELRAEGVYNMNEILPEIDIEATVAAFVSQIQRLDFSKPALISKPRVLTEKSNLVS